MDASDKPTNCQAAKIVQTEDKSKACFDFVEVQPVLQLHYHTQAVEVLNLSEGLSLAAS